MIIDSHCHLDYEPLISDINKINSTPPINYSIYLFIIIGILVFVLIIVINKESPYFYGLLKFQNSMFGFNFQI